MNNFQCKDLSSPRPRHLRASAFTLVEVLASLMLIAIVLPVALRAISLSAANTSLAAQRTEAAALAQMKLNQLIVARDYDIGEQVGDFGDEWPNYQWRSNISNWSGQSLLQVDATVTWVHRGMQHGITLNAIMFDDHNQ